MNKRIVLLLAVLFGALTSAFAGPYDTWSNYKTITVNTGNAVNDTNYPELVRLSNSSAATGSDILSGSLTAGGLDVVFTDSTGQTAYNFERERFTSTNGEFWVRLPMLRASQNTRFRVYWGKSAATDLTSGAGVWDTTSTLSATPGNAYRAVWHMNGTGATETDVTANHWQLLSGGLASPPTTMIPTAQVASPIVYGRNLNASGAVLSPSGFSTPNGVYFLNSVQGNSAGTGWAVGNLGTILKTTDGGNTWTAQTSNTTRNFRAVYFTDANHGIAVGDSGTIDTTASGGANWSLITDPYAGTPGIGFYTVTFIDTLGAGTTSPLSLQTGYIGGDDGTLTRITNFGTPASAAYTTIATGTSGLSPTLSVRGIACDINTCLIVGDSGQSRSIWGLQSTITYKAGAGLSTSFNLVGATYTGHPGLFFAAGDSAGTAGVIYKIFNPNSVTAITVTKFVPKWPGFPPNGTVGFPPLKAIAAGIPDSVLAGQGAVGGGGFYYGAQSVAAWAVGNNGTIVRTMNTGTSWGLYPSGTSNNLTCVSVPFGATTKFASDFGWAGGASGTLLTAGNFGQWFSVNTGTTVTYSAGAYSTIKNQLNFVDSSAYTITTWVNQRNYDNDVHAVTGKGDQFYVLQEDAGQHYNAAVYYSGFQNWYGQNASNHGVTENLNAWHYLAMTRLNPVATNTNTQIWLDGVNIDSSNGTPGTISQTPNATLAIGRTLDGGNAGDSLRFFPGTLSHMTFASVGRSASWLGADFATQSASQTAVTEAGTAGVPIVVTTQPANDTVTSGSATSLTVVATGGGGAISYKWYKNGAAMTDAGDVTGSGTATLSFSSVAGGDPAVYKCALVNQVGDSSFTNNASLVIATTPGFTGYASPKSYVAGQPIIANNPTVTGNPSTCTSVPTLPTGLAISNATCVISGTPTVGTATATYTITATNIAGSTPTTVSITIYDTVANFTSQPAGHTTAAFGATAKIGAAIGSALGGDVAVTYLWQRLKKSGVIDTPQVHSGVTSLSDTLSVGPLTAADDSSQIRVLVSNTAGVDTSRYDTLRVAPFILHASASVTYGRNNGIVDTDASTNTGGLITSCSVSPTLPAGLVVTLNPSVLSCAITGTPTAWAVPAKFGITATGPGGTSPFDSVTVTVLNKATAMTYGPSSVTYEEGQRIIPNTPFVADSVPQTPFSYSLVSGSLPPGLSLNSATGAITGTVSNGDAGSSPYVDSIIAFNVADTVGFKLTMNVFAPETYTSGSHADFTLDTRSTAGNVVTSQANFPVLVRLNLAHKSILVNDSTGIRFTNSSGLHLPYQIAHWSYTGGDTSAAIWVSPDTVYGSSSAGTTTIRMYYNTGLSTSRSNGANVFGRGNGHLAVWHMNEASGNAADASGSGFNAVVGGAAPGAASGAPLPGGRSFNGSTQDFYAPTVGTISSATYFEFGLGNSYAVSTWASDNVTGSVQGMISHGNQDWQLQIQRGSGNKGYEWSEWSSTSTFQNADENVAHTDLNWHYVVGIKNPASPYLQIYVDGVLQTSNSTSNDNTTGAGPKTGGNATFGLVLGAYSNGVQGTPTAANDFFTGSMVESRVLNKNVTGDWVRLNYLTQRATANPITNLSYSNASPSFVNGVAITTDSPSVVGTATRYTISNGSTVTDSTSFHNVTGLTFTTASGKITGTPNATLSNSPFTVTAYGDSAWSTTSNLSITVNNAPIITSNPASQVVNQGTTVKFGVTLTAGATTPLVYYWVHVHGGIFDTLQRDTLSVLTDTLTLVSAPLADTGSYKVSVTNVAGNATSTSATLGIQVAPSIASNPSSQSANVGNTVKFGVTLNSGATTPIVYAWLHSHGGTTDTLRKDTLSVLTDTLTLTSIPLADTGSYDAYITNAVGSATSTSALLSLSSGPSIGSNPSNQSAIVGTTVKFGVTVTGGVPLVYSWLHSHGGTTDTLRMDTLSVLTDTLVLPNIPLSDTGTFSAYVTNVGGNATSTSASLTITAATFTYSTPTAVYGKRLSITPDTVSVTGAVTHFSVSSPLPSGLVLDSVTGKISGTPTVSTTMVGFAVTGSNGPLSSTDSIYITVNGFSYVTNHPALFGKNVAVAPDSLKNVVGTFSHFSVSPALPSGLSLDSAAGIISGTPTVAAAAAKYAVTGTYSGGTAVDTLDITVLGFAYATQPVTFVKNSLITPDSVHVVVGPLTHYAVSPALPAGLTLDTNIGVITGTPSANQAPANFVVTASDSGKASTVDTLSIAVNSPPVIATNPASQTANVGTTVKFGVSVNAGATMPLVYAWLHTHGGTTDTLLKDTLSALTDTLVLASAPLADTGSYKAVVSNTSGSVTSASATLTLDVPPTIASNPAGRSAIIGTTVKFGVSVNAGATTPLVYAWLHGHGGATDTLRKDTLSVLTDTLVLTNIPISDTGTFSAYVTNMGGNATSTSASLTITAATFTYSTPTAVYGKRLAITPDTVSVTGAITRFSVTPALPSGVALDSVTGKISGTPTAATATGSYVVTGSNGALSSNDTLSITVNGFSYVTNHPALFGKNVAIASDSLKNVVGTFTAFAVSPALPTGLSLNASTGILSGTPTVAAAAAKYAVTGTYSGGTAVDTLDITVLGFTYATQPVTFVKNSLITPDSVHVVVGPLTHYAVSPALPAGLTLDTNIGVITGTPTANQAPANYVVTASDSGNASTVDTLSIAVNAAPVIATNPSSQTANVGTKVKFGVSVNAGATMPLVYAWLHTHGGTTDTLLKDTLSALTDTLVLASAPLADTGSYKAVVSNTSGSVTSASATLTLDVPPTIASNPAGRSSIIGTTVKFGVSVNAGATTPFVYAWLHGHGGTTDTLRKDTLSVLTDTLVLTNIPLSDTGTYSAYVTNVAGNISSTSASLTITAATFTYSTPTAVYGKRLAITPDSVSVTGTVTRFSVTPALPTGLVLDSVTGKISGTPTAATATGSYVVTGSNGSLSSNDTLSITVNGFSYVTNHPALFGKNAAIAPDSLKNVVGTFTAFAVSPALPAGLSLNASTGILIGTPTVAAAAAKYAVTGTYSGGTAVDTLGITVLGFTYATQPVTFVKNSLITPDSVHVVVGPLTHYAVSPALPAGLTLDTNIGVITGTPSANQAPANFVVTASDSGKASTVDTLSIGVSSVATPTASVPGQAFLGTIKVALSTTSGGATIHYTTNGLTPDSTSATYTDTLTFSSTTTLQAVAVLSGAVSGVLSQTYTLNTPPSISIAPHDTTVLSGALASFTVVATAPGTLHYQWLKNGVNVSNSPGHISGATAATLTDSLVSIADTATYTVTVTDSLGTTATQTTSGGGRLIVNAAPSISVQPLAITKTVGSVSSFFVTASGSGRLGYQWQKNGVNVSNSGGHISGATAATLTDSSVAVGDTGTYTVVVTDSLNGSVSSATSSGAYLTVNAAPSISVQPSPLTKLIGNSANFSVTASGGGHLGYQWQKNGVNLSNAGTVSGVTTATLSNSAVAAGDTGTYAVVVTDTLNGTVSSTTSSGAYLTINAAPSISAQPSALTKVVGTSASFSVTASGAGHLGYQWQKNTVNLSNAGTVSGVTTATLNNSAVAVGDTGTYTVIVTDSLGGTVSSTTSSGAYLTVNAAPNISVQPSATSKVAGASVSFSVTASGSGQLGYQWKKNGVNLSNAGTVSGVTTSTLNISAVAGSDTGAYTVFVTDTLNSTVSSVTSTGAHLTVTAAAPSISVQPSATSKVVGASASFSVTASGSSVLVYQWKKNGVNLSNTGTVSGVTTATLSISAVAGSDTGTYTVAVTDSLNGSTASVTSSGAFLTVTAAAPSISVQPSATSKVAGASASFSVTASGSSVLVYQWKKNGVNLSNAGTVSGVTTATLNISAVAGSDTGTYTVAVTDSLNGSTASVTSSGALLTVTAAAPSISVQPSATSKVAGASASFSVTASGSSVLVYQWKKNGVNLSNAGTVSGVNTATLSNSAVAGSDTGTYTVIVTDSLNGSTASVTSSGAFLTVTAVAPSISIQPSATSKVAGASASFSVTASGSSVLVYQWKKNGVNLSNAGTVSGVNTATLTNSAVAGSDSGTYTVIVTDSLNGTTASVTSNGAHLTVTAAAPNISVQPSATSKVAGASASFSVTASGTGTLNYQWQKNGVNLSNGGTVSGVFTATLTNSAVAAADSGTYTVIVSDSLNGTSASVTSSGAFLTVTANAPNISVQPSPLTKTLGASASFSVTASGSGTLSYQWQKNGLNLSNAGTVSGVTTATLSNSAVAATDTGTYTVIVTNTLNGTLSTTTSTGVYLTINVAPVVTTQPHDTTVLVGGSANFTVAATGSGTLTYQWQKNGTNVSNGSGGTSATFSLSSVAAADSGVYTVIVTNTLNGTTASTTSGIGRLMVNVAPVITTQPQAATKTLGSSASFSVVSSGFNPLLVAGGTSGAILTSPDGINWTSQTSGTTLNITSVTSSGNQLVATASQGGILTSPDGITWTTQNSGVILSGVGLASGAWTGSQTVVVGASGAILTSPDGITWTSRTSGTANTLNGVIWTGSQFVAVGLVGTVVTSPDGITWTSRTSGTTNQLNGVAWTGSQFVATGASGTILTSPDGVTWTTRTSGVSSPNDLQAITWTGSQLVTTGGHLSTSSIVLTSPDGVTWTSRNSGTTQSLWGVTWTGSKLVAVGVNGSNVIITSPDGVVWTSQTFSGGSKFLIDVAFVNGPPNYQWKKNGIALSNGGTLSGATTATVSISSVATTDTGTYSVVVSKTLNGTTSSATSSGAFLTLNAPPVITTPPVALTKAIGASASFTVAATGSGTLSYQWQKNGSNLSNAGTVSGVTTATLSNSAVAAGDTGTYTVVITNTLNGTTSTTTSTGVYLTLNAAPVITTPPVALTKAIGASASFTVVATGSGTLSYQWQKNGSNLSNAGTLSGVTTATLSNSAVAAGDTGTYTVSVTSTLNGTLSTTTSTGAYLTINAAPVVTTQPHDTTALVGGSASFTVAATGSGTLSYQWQKNGTNVSNGSGGTSTTFSLSSVAAADSGVYTVIVTNTLNGTTASTTSSTGKLIVNVAPVITTQPQATTKLLGSSASFSVAGSGFNALLVASGFPGAIQTSPDGVNWTTQNPGTTNTITSATWAGNQLVATVGQSSGVGAVRTSPDGITWTSQNVGITLGSAGLNSGAWTGSQIVVVGASGAVLTSTDGINWTSRTSGLTSAITLHKVIWAGSQLVAVGDGSGTIITSPDGITWTQRASGLGSGITLYAVAWTGTQLVAVGSSGTIITSPDGVIWTTQTSGVSSPNDLQAITWTGSQFVATGGHTSTSSVVVTSPDGVTWTSRTSGTNQSLWGVAWTGSKLVAVGSNVGNVALTSPDGVTWTAQASGTTKELVDLDFINPLSYQWKKNGNVLSNGGTLSGATSTTLNISAVAATDTGTYSVVLSKTLNGTTSSTASSGALLILNASPVITTPPVALTKAIGASASFTVAATGSGTLSYQWQKNGSNLSNAGTVSGVTTATLSNSAVAAGDTGTYTVVITNTLNGTTSTTTSTGVYLTLNAAPVITTPPVALTKAIGGSASFTVSATGSGTLSYQWQKNGSNLSNAGTVSGVTTTTLSNSAVAAGDTGTYTVVITNTLNGTTSTTTSTGVYLTLNAAPVITTPPVALTKAIGASASFTVAATGSGTLTYQWQKNGSNLSNAGAVSGATTPTLNNSAVAAGDTGTYTVVITNTLNGTTSTTTSTGVYLTLNAAPVITTPPVALTKAIGASASFTVAATGSGTLTYQWQKNGSNLSNAGTVSGVTTTTLSNSAVAVGDTGTYTVVITNTVNGTISTTTSTGVYLAINVAPLVTTQPHDTTVIVSGGARFTVAATAPGTIHYQWQKNGTNVSNGSGGNTATFSLSSVAATDTGSYKVILTDSLGTTASLDTSSAGRLVVNFTPVISVQPQPVSAVVSAAESLTVTAATGIPGAQFVAGGSGGTILTSPDGVTWTSRTSGTTNFLTRVASTGAQVISVGGSGTILTSPDGVTWTSRISGTSSQLNGVTSTGSQLVSVGDNGKILTSPDGVTWTSRTSGTGSILIDVAWNGSQFVSVGASGTILTSPDGVTWTSRTSGTASTLWGVAWSGSQFAVAGSSGKILTSPDGVTWTSRTSGTSQALEGMSWTGNQFVALGTGGGIFTSPDGVTWTSRTSGVSELQVMAANGNQNVAIGNGGIILTSPDGVSWTSRTSGTAANFGGVAWTGGLLGYQWAKNGSNLSNGGTLSGVNTSKLQISSVANSDTGTYTVAVTSALNGTTSQITGTGAYLTVNTPPIISSQPSAITKTVGAIGSFSVTASGSGTLSYQWQKNGSNLSNTGTISGVTTATLSNSAVAAGDTGTYTVVITNTLNGTTLTTTSTGAYLTLNAAPVITTPPVALTKLIGASASFAVVATGSGTLSYQWQKNGSNLSNAGTLSGVTTATLSNSAVAAGDTGTYTVVITNTLNSTTSTTTSTSVYLTLNTAPVITTPPVALTKAIGASASFTVVATGSGTLSYQWQKNGSNLSNAGTLSGVTTATLSNSAVAAGDTGTYTVVITNTLNSTTSTTTSTGVYLTLNTAPVITTPPVALTEAIGASASFTVVATGSGTLSYQWQKNGSNLSNAGTLSGVTTATLSNSAVAAGDTGTYMVVITNTLNSTTSMTTSAGVYLTLNMAPVITTPPVALTKAIGASASFTVVATGSGTLSYQWQKNGSNLSNAATLSGVTTATLSNSAVAAGDTGTYTVVITNTLNSTTSMTTSAGVYLTLNTAPVITTQPVALTKLAGASAAFTVVATGPTGGHLGYQWQKNGSNLSNAGTLSGVTTATLSNSAVTATDTGTYSVMVTDTLSGTVSSVTSNGAFLTINTAPVISTQPVALTKGLGSIASFTVVASGPIGGHLGYQWQKSGVNLNNALNLSGVTTATLRDSVAANDTGTYTVVVTDTLGSTVSSTTSNGAILTVNTAPVISTQPVALTRTLGASASFTVVATGSGTLSYQWQKNGVNLSNAGTISGVTTATLSNSAVAAGDTGTYTVIVTSTLNATTASTTSTGAFLTMNGAPVITTQPAALTKTVGSIATFTVAATGPTGGHLGYQWQKNGISLSSSVSLTGVTSATLRDSVAATDTGTYAVIVTDTLGGTISTITSSSAFLTVNTAPVISTQPVAQTKTVGSITTFTVVATGPTGGHLGYQWQKNGVSVSNAGTLSGVTTATLRDSVAATDTGTYTVIVTDSLGGTVSSTTSTGAFLTINTAAAITTQPAALTKLVGAAASFTVVATGPTGGHLGYQWQKNGSNLNNVGTLSGATTATLSNSAVAVNDTGTYKVIVTDTLNGTVSTITSNGAFLTLNTAPVISTQPVALTKGVGSIGTFTVAATGPTGGHLGYQWQKNGVFLSSSVSLTGVNTATLRDSVAASDTGTYSVIVTDTLGGTVSSSTSTGAVLTVNTAPVISTQPVAQTKTVGSITTFTVVATGPTGGHLGYQWQKNGVAVSNVGTLSGVTTAILRDSVAATDTGTYSVVVTDTLGGTVSSTTSSGAFLAVNTSPVISTQPSALTKTVGSIGTFTVVATGPVGGHLGYQWQKNGVPLSSSASVTGVTSVTLRDSVAATDTGTYTVLVTDTLGGTVSSTLSSGAFLTVNTAPVITTQPVAQTKTVGGIATFTVVATGPTGGHLGYQWQKNGAALNNSVSLTGVTTATLRDSAAITDSGTYTVVITDTLNGTTASTISSGAYLTVNSLPSLTSQPVSIKIAAGGNATFTVTASGGVAPLTYQWFSGATALSDTTGLAGSKTATLTLTGVPGPDSGRTVANVTVVVSSAGNAGSVTSGVATFTVNALPKITAQPQSVTTNLGQTAVFTVAATKGVGPLVYQWFKGVTPLTDSGRVSGSKTATLTLTNITGADTGGSLYHVVVANVDSVGSVTSNTVSLQPPVAIFGNVAKAFAIRTAGSSVFFQLPAGAASAQITLLDVWGRPVWSRTLGHGIDQITWNGNSASGSRSTGAGLYIIRMVLFDAQQHQTGIIQRKFSYTP